jgi:predicted outer membrane repeat protein
VAGVPGQEGGYGGALSGFNIQVNGATFVENHAEFTGGAISAEGSRWRLRNAVFLDNTSSNQWGLSQTCTDTLRGGGAVQWPAPTASGDPPCTDVAVLADPLLGDLSDNGGPTQTIPLLSGSPALSAGQDCPSHDQRGEPRPASCDLGAYEAP